MLVVGVRVALGVCACLRVRGLRHHNGAEHNSSNDNEIRNSKRKPQSSWPCYNSVERKFARLAKDFALA